MPISVIGAGQGRTGTMTLKLALEQLGFGPSYHMVEVFKNPAAFGWWLEAAQGRPDWERIFSGYRSTTDYPGASFWRELALAYPDAKVILTVRNPDDWYRSTQETIFSRGVPPPEAGPLSALMQMLVDRDFAGDVNTREHVLARHHAHNEAVKRGIAPERLLVYDVGEGWAPLCAFLGVPVPAGPMPHANTREEFRREHIHRLGQAQA